MISEIGLVVNLKNATTVMPQLRGASYYRADLGEQVRAPPPGARPMVQWSVPTCGPARNWGIIKHGSQEKC